MRVGIAVALLLAVAGPGMAAVEPPAESPIGGDVVKFQSDDGVSLIGHVFRPSTGEVRGAIIFVHEPFRTQRDWAYLAERMTKRGFVSLIFDLRGHGESLKRGSEDLDRELFGKEDFQAMTKDVAAAAATLRKQPGVVADSLQVIGADLGGSLGLLAALADSGIRSVGLLSPGLGYDEVNIVGAAGKLGDRPLLLVYSVEDGYSRKSTEVLSAEASGPVHVETYFGVGHGTKMMAREAALEGLLQAWFLGTVITAEGRDLADTGKPQGGEKTAEGAEIDAEAEKKKLEQQKKDAENAGAVKDGDEGEKKRWDLD